MAIAVDATANGFQASGTSLSYSHTCTGSNLALFVGIRSGSLPTGITYNGVAMTNINTANAFGAGTASLWVLVNPATGANNIVVSVSPATQIQAMSVSYTGVSQSGMPDSQNTNSVSSATSITTSTTTVADNCWVVGLVADNGAGVLSASTGATQRSRIAGANGNSCMVVDTNGVVTPAGSKSMTVTDSATGNIGFCVASFAPFTASPTTVDHRYLSLLGVGQ